MLASQCCFLKLASIGQSVQCSPLILFIWSSPHTFLTPRSVVAARLANAGQSVLLLEAGSDGSLLTEIPAAVGATLGTSLDW